MNMANEIVQTEVREGMIEGENYMHITVSDKILLSFPESVRAKNKTGDLVSYQYPHSADSEIYIAGDVFESNYFDDEEKNDEFNELVIEIVNAAEYV